MMLQKDEERLGFDTGTDESILDKRLKSMVKEEVKYAKEYGDDYFKKGKYVFSFGNQTWPHLLVRIMLIEQIYRSLEILKGTSYHK